MEKFVQLVDFPNYLINKNGVIKNKKFNKILIGTSSWKYPAVNLSRNRIKYKRTIHRLLAINFIPNPLNKTEVNHINGITTDFSISNLEWVTPKENIHHSRHLSKNGSVISRQKIEFLFNNNKHLNNIDLIELLKDNCR
jgi:hypothetical protein